MTESEKCPICGGEMDLFGDGPKFRQFGDAPDLYWRCLDERCGHEKKIDEVGHIPKPVVQDGKVVCETCKCEISQRPRPENICPECESRMIYVNDMENGTQRWVCNCGHEEQVK